MWRVACGLSNAIGRTISNGDSTIEAVPLAQVSAYAGGLEKEMVGVYLVMQSGLRGQAILILPMSSALNLADSMMGEPPGTATYLGTMERSALAEVGNLALSYFLNAATTYTEQEHLLRPSPPAVMVDMLGAIINVVVTPAAVMRDDLLIIDTPFSDAQSTVQARFWVLPDPAIPDLRA
jgi:chemotaxis protein CheC